MWDDYQPKNQQGHQSQYGDRDNSNGGQRPYQNQGQQKQYGGQNKKPWPKRQEPEGDATLYLPFAFGVNQDAPESLAGDLELLINKLDQLECTARVGGNKGPDEMFEKKMKKVEVHLPWRNFNEKESKFTFNTTHMHQFAQKHSPVYDKFSDAIKAMLARNVRMIYGNNLKSPALFLITWSQDGCERASERTAKTGNVGHLISLASSIRIPIFNLNKPDAIKRIINHLEQV